MAQPSFHGRFIWTELLCNDSASATAFYSRILPWKAQLFSPGSPYLVFSGKSGRPLAGAMGLTDEMRAKGAKAHWRCYVGVADVDATVTRAVALGASVRQPATDMPGVGRAAMLVDPQGAQFGLYCPEMPSSDTAPQEKGFSWHELATREREAALAFYQKLFGWELRAPIDMGGGFHYQTFGLVKGMDIGGCYTIPAERPMPPAWCPYADCVSADEVAAKVAAAGGGIAHGPVDVPGGGRIVQFFDPERVMFAVHSMPRAMPRAKAIPKPAPTVAKKTAKKAVRKVAKKAVKKTVKRKVAKRPAKKVAKQAKKRVAKKSMRRARKPTRKPLRKVARKPMRKPARKK